MMSVDLVGAMAVNNQCSGEKRGQSPCRLTGKPGIMRSAIAGSLALLLSTIMLATLAPAIADDALLPTAPLTPAEEIAVDKMALPVPKPSLGDFDVMRQHRFLRILVVNSRTLYFLDRGRELGIDKEFAAAFEDALNKKYKTKSLKIHVALIPVARDKLLSALKEGLGDVAAGALTITPERQALVDFADPFASGVKEVLVTGPAAPALASLDDLAGQHILVRKSSSYYAHLLSVNADLMARHLAPIDLQPAAEDLEDEDLLEMVDAGLLPYAVVDRYTGVFWSQVYQNLTVRSDLAINQGGDIAWAIRKNSPLLKAELDDFVKTHKVGTSFGNTIVLRYLKTAKVIHNASSASEMAKFQKLVGFFQTYAGKYKFNDLMMMAQGYQESQLDQSRRSPRGAVGVMQLLPSTAADKSIGITGIDSNADRNIEAGIKYMALLRDKYLNDPAISDKNKMLMTFAAYNAGPGNLAKFRRLAEKSDLDPNIWFNNVELAAARIVGQETVQYVSNIYKYYVAYELVKERAAQKAAAKAEAASGSGTGVGTGRGTTTDTATMP
jgi:membrane-bound lytic murein transglycosylase MltF